MEKKTFQKLLLNKTTVAELTKEEMKLTGGIVEESCEEPVTAKTGVQDAAEAAFLSIVTCTHENGSHCRRCSSCCVGTKCSK